MIFTTLNENGEIIFNENKGPVRCPECGSIETSKVGLAYRCSQCNTKFMPNSNKDDE